jgi:4-hydroxy-tetrahydrodipicolinate synthase
VANDARTLCGIWSATLTPVDAGLQPDAPRAIAYYAELLDGGCDGLNVLGTTGEAMSFGIEQRIAFIKAIACELPPECVMAGAGAASLEDTIRLTRCALECGLRAVLVLPPFFFRDAATEGVVEFYVRLAEAVPEIAGRLLLYNFPRMSGFTFTPDVVARLMSELSGAIVGLKDSSNERRLQRDLIAEFPALRVFPGSEGYLPEAMRDGAAGCISGTVALWPRLAQAALRGDAVAVRDIANARDAFADLPIIPAMRYAVAKTRGDDGWLRAMPPLSPLSRDEIKTLEHRLTALETFSVE